MSLWAKRDSFSAHFAWGALILMTVRGWTGEETGFVLAILAGCLWELVLDAISRRAWRTRALDVLPWALGAGIWWAISTEVL